MSARIQARRPRIEVRYAPQIAKGRIPPHDLDAEANVLSAMLLNRDAVDVVLEMLEPQHFYSDANARIFEAIHVLALEGRPVDVGTVATNLRDRERFALVGGAVYLALLADATPAVHNVAAHAATVKEKWRLRTLIATCQRFAAEGYGDVGSVQDFVDGAEQEIYELAHTSERREMRSLRVALAEEFSELVKACERGDTLLGYATGYPQLDELLSGLCPGDLTLIAGRPGMGKSAAAASLGLNVASPRTARAPALDGEGYVDVPNTPGYGVCFFGLEMPEAQTRARIICSEARVDLTHYRKRRLAVDDWRRLTEAGQWLAPLPFWLDDKPALSLLELRAKVRRKQAEYNRPEAPGVPAQKVGLVVVDYIQLMGAPEGIDSREQQVSYLSRGLKNLAKELGVAVVALAQLNREVETRSTKDKRPQLSDLRESGSLEQDADNVLLLYRDDYYHPDTRDRGIAEWILAKARNGALGTVRVKWTGSFTRFDPLAPGEGPDEEEA